MRITNKFTVLALCLILQGFFVNGQKEIVLDLTQKGAEINPGMYGVFFEDINFGADGGLYAERVKNRSFEFDQAFVGWLPFGDVQLKTEAPCFDRNPHYVRLNERELRRKTGLENEGFRRMGFRQNDSYEFSFYARSIDGGEKMFRIELVSSEENIIGTAQIQVQGAEWNKYSTQIIAGETNEKGKLRLFLETAGEVDLDHISLFPSETWKNRKNGLRKDLVEALYDLNPGVFRFPGGCVIEGNTLETRYQWKNSVGPVENRPINENRWNYNFEYRFFPDYYQTYGLGFFEFFQLCEDLGADALPVVSCGLACQFESTECVPVSDLGPYIQDALDLIEFANGSVQSKWGKVRAEMGHPEPFGLKMIAIGNEQWGEVYIERLEQFVEAFREKYPEIKIIGSSGPFSDGEYFDYLWPKMKELKADLVDEHYYKSPEWFLKNANRYDSYDRNGPKVFAGEFAAHDKNRANNLRSALAEAAFMTGLERNSDLVRLSTYAPLFAHVDAWQWKPDLIWFNNLKVVKTPNYYVQQMYANNVGTNVLSLTSEGEAVSGKDSIYASSVIDTATSEIIIKLVNVSSQKKDIQFVLKGLGNAVLNKTVKVTYLHNNNPDIVNSIATGSEITPEHYSFQADKNGFVLPAYGNAFYLCRIQLVQ